MEEIIVDESLDQVEENFFRMKALMEEAHILKDVIKKFPDNLETAGFEYRVNTFKGDDQIKTSIIPIPDELKAQVNNLLKDFYESKLEKAKQNIINCQKQMTIE